MSDTLGARIDAMFQHYIRDDFDAPESREALLARADAAERLAVAVDVLDRDDWREVDADGVPLVANEHDNALAAWRAITGEVQP